jgi:AraC family transcriptional regulator, regulatory protein of adaptative response / methylated-DNA-[protein]-cysteine methyltransferase
MKHPKTTARGDLPSRSESKAWRAVVARDRRADKDFVFAVRTTGIYCVPSCSARRPKRANVVYYTTTDAAERDGYRPCQRCRPRDMAKRTLTEQRINAAVDYLHAHSDRRVSLAELAKVVAVSPFHLQRTFKAVVGVSPKRYQDAKRAERLKKQLRGGGTVSRAMYEAGYGSSRGGYEASRRLGITPGDYRSGGAGLQIGYTILPSALGRILVATTPRGVCAVSIGDDDSSLEAELRSEFPKADAQKLSSTNPSLREAVRAVRACLDGKQQAPNVRLALEGTPFQLRVWDALRQIPAGETRSYGEIATVIGNESAARAVGTACATNRVALLGPCHRAGREDGRPGGYRWGLDRKQSLLAREEERKG